MASQTQVQPQVVSSGMRVTEDKIERAKTTHAYIKVGETSGQLLLSGAAARWNQEKFADYIYLSDLRLAGHPEDVRMTLKNTGKYTDAQIEQCLKSAYTAKSITNPQMEAKYKEELEQLEKYRKSQVSSKPQVQSNPTITLSMLSALVSAIPNAQTVKATRVAREEDSEDSGTKRPGRRIPLQTRLNNLKSNQVIDVTKMKKDGTGAKVVLQPGEASAKVGCSAYRIVSSNLDMFKAALTCLGLSAADQQKYVDEWTANSKAAAALGKGGAKNDGAPKRGRKAETKPTTTQPAAAAVAPKAAVTAAPKPAASVARTVPSLGSTETKAKIQAIPQMSGKGTHAMVFPNVPKLGSPRS